jgi:hypothetical protein
MRWIGSKYDTPTGRWRPLGCVEHQSTRHDTGERVTATRAEFINNRNFALVATGVAIANDVQGVDFALNEQVIDFVR